MTSLARLLLIPSLLLILKAHAQVDWSYVIEHIDQKPPLYHLNYIYGGASNINCHLILDNKDYFVRFAQPKKALYADLSMEFEVLQLLSPLGVSPTPLFYHPEKGILVTHFIPHEEDKIDLLDPATRQGVIALLHTIENANITISRTFQPYRDVIRLVEHAHAVTTAPLSAEFYHSLLPALQDMEATLSKNTKKSLCHMDLHGKNILKNQDRFWIIDWEYATMSHPFLVLASMASIERWNDQQMQTLLKDYTPSPTLEDFYRLYLYRMIADIFWTVWNHVQLYCSTIDYPYSKWEKLFEDAALQRLSSQQYIDAMTYLKQTHSH